MQVPKASDRCPKTFNTTGVTSTRTVRIFDTIAPASSGTALTAGMTGLICAQTAGYSGVTGTLYGTTTNGGRDAL